MESGNNTLTPAAARAPLPLLIARARNSVLRLLEAEMAPLQVSTVQCMILLRLHSGGENTAGALSRFSGIDSGAMTRLVDRLVGKELLARAPDARDRRAVRLVLTDRALKLVPRLQACIDHVHRHLVQRRQGDDVATVAAFLAEVVEGPAPPPDPAPHDPPLS